MPQNDGHWMKLALQQAEQARLRGEVPVGAVLVLNGAVVAGGYNQPIGLHDPSAHAEVMALRGAGQALQNYRMPGLEMFVTLEPCAMCAMAMMHARISRVVYAASDPKTGAAGSVLNLFEVPELNHQTQVEGGVMAAESAALLQAFFRERRLTHRSQGNPS
ncbi:MAG: tRNA adenosine(34) deaminase TadA [Betaproteobacteria bacterium]